MHSPIRRATRLSALALACGSIFIAGCRPRSAAEVADDGEEHAHDAEELAVVLTEWAEGYELFIEYPPPVVNESFRLITHVTRIADGRARSDGAITLRLLSPSGSMRAVEIPTPVREGIYLPEITLEETGEWGYAIEIPGKGAPTHISLPGIQVYASAHDAQHARIPAAPEGTTFLKEQQWRLGTLIGEVELHELQERITVPGRVRAVPARRAVVSPPVAGLFEAPSGGSLPSLGEHVEAGQLLGYVQPPGFEFALQLASLRAATLDAQIEVTRTELLLNRTRALHELEARSDRELEEARYEHEHAKAALDASNRAVGLLEGLAGEASESSAVPRFELRAPLSGSVQSIGAVLGQAVKLDDELLHLLDTSFVHVEANPRPEQLARVDTDILPTWTRHAGHGAIERPIAAEARLVFIASEVREPGHSVPVVFEVANPDRKLLVGELLEVGLATGEARLVPAIPVEALVDIAGEAVAYVQLGGETFEARYLELGLQSDGWVEVAAGLEPGEHVVLRRPYAIRLASASGIVPTHTH